MTIVATGRTGSIGSYLPASVSGLQTRLEAGERQMEEELIRAKAEVLIHLAAMTSVQECERNPERAHLLNVEGARRWLRAAAKSRLRHFLYVSTSHVFRPTEEKIWLAPERPGDATSAYGKSKWQAELALLEEARGLAIGFGIARVFSVVAPADGSIRDFYLQSGLRRRARERDFSPLPGYKNVRDFIDTKEIAANLLRLAQEPDTAVAVRAHHVCTGKPISVRELAIREMTACGIKESEMAPMFVDDASPANYLISKPN